MFLTCLSRSWLPAVCLLAAGRLQAADASVDWRAVVQPEQAVPPVIYRSVFEGLARGVETGSADWPRANAEVGQFRRGHVDILKWEQQHAPEAARPAGAGGAAPPAAGHHGHGVSP